MALTFSSKGCTTAADELSSAQKKLDQILNGDLKDIMKVVKSNYESEAATDVYNAFDKITQKFPEFIRSVNECEKYLRDTVAPAYEKLEAKIAQGVK